MGKLGLPEALPVGARRREEIMPMQSIEKLERTRARFAGDRTGARVHLRALLYVFCFLFEYDYILV